MEFPDIVNTFLPNAEAMDGLVQLGVTPEEISALTPSDFELLAAADPALVSTLLDNAVSLSSVVNTWLPDAPALSVLFSDLGVSIRDTLPLTDAMVPLLLSEDPADIQASLDSGYTLAQHCEFSAQIHEAVEQGQITQAEAQDPTFVASIKDQILGQGMDLADAIAASRLAVRLESYPNADALIAEIPSLSPEQVSGLLSVQEEDLDQLLAFEGITLAGLANLSDEQREVLLTEGNPELINGLLNNGVSITGVATAFLPNASAISWVRQAGATIQEISAMSADELQALSAAKSSGVIIYGTDMSSPIDVDSAVPTQIMEFAGGAILVNCGATTYGGHVAPGYIVTQQANPEICNQMRGKYATTQIEALRKEHGLPATAELDILGYDTTVPVDPDDPSAGFYTVGELTMNRVLELAGSGAMGANKIAELQFALEARGALENGYDLLPYYEKPGAFGSTYREYFGGHSNPTIQALTPADLGDMLDEEAINQRIEDLMADPVIQDAYNAQLNRTLDEFVPNPEAFVTLLGNKI